MSAIYVAGPAKITYGGVTFLTRGDVRLTEGVTTQKIENGVAGTLHEIPTAVEHSISFEPDGRVNQAIMDVLYGCMDLLPGAQLFDGTKTLVIHGTDGFKRTYANSALIKPPDFKGTTKATPFGAVEFKALPKPGAAMFADTTLSWDGVAGFDHTEIMTMNPALAFGATSPWDSFGAKDGFTLKPTLSVTPVPDDTLGICNYMVTDSMAEVSLIPNGPTPAQIATALGHANLVIGAPLRSAEDLVMTLGDWVLTLKNAQLKSTAQTFSSKAIRQGEVVFVGARSVTTGVFDPMLAWALTE